MGSVMEHSGEIKQRRREKRVLRRRYMKWRCELAIAEWQRLSRGICDRLSAQPEIQNATTIFGYQSHRQEPDLSGLWCAPLAQSKVWGLPRCVKQGELAPKPTHLCWHRWDPSVPLLTGYCGLAEPDSAWPVLTPEQVDLILVPMVAGDRLGYRLGYGGGFYDRLFSQSQWQSIPKVGITFEALLVDRLPHDPWDRPLDAICTEHQWLQISP